MPRPVTGTPLPRLTAAALLAGAGTIRSFFRFEPGADGTMTVLGYQVLKAVPASLHLILRALFGVRDLRADLRQNMTSSLQRIAGIAGRQVAQPRQAADRD